MKHPTMDGDDLFQTFLHNSRKKDVAATACLNSFIARGIKLKDVRDKNNNTLLHQAASRGCPGAARILLEHGSDPMALNNVAKTPISVSDDFKKYGTGYKAVHALLADPPPVMAVLPSSQQESGEEAGAHGEQSASEQNSADSLLGKRIVKEFSGYGFFEGIVATDEGDDGLRIMYEDGTSELLSAEDTAPLAAKFQQWYGEAKKAKALRKPGQTDFPQMHSRNAKPDQVVGTGKRVLVLWEQDQVFYAGAVQKAPQGLLGPLAVLYDNGDTESKLDATTCVILEQKGVKWAKQNGLKGSAWWPAMVWQCIGNEDNAPWNFVQFLGRPNSERSTFWLDSTTVIDFEDGLESHLDGILQTNGSLDKLTAAEQAVELAFAQLSREKQLDKSSRKRKRKKGKDERPVRKKTAPADAKTAAQRREEMYEEEIFYTVMVRTAVGCGP